MDARIVELGEKIHDALVAFGAFGEDLGGGCAVGSALLVRAMRKQLGLYGTFVASPCYGGYHAFVTHGNYIYDITATQFGHPDKVCVVRKSEARKLQITALKEAYLSKEREMISEVNRSWYPPQRPNRYRLAWDGNSPIVERA
jgi:hypothetical protein